MLPLSLFARFPETIDNEEITALPKNKSLEFHSTDAMELTGSFNEHVAMEMELFQETISSSSWAHFSAGAARFA